MTVLLLAVALDLLLGDPPNRFHPVAWIGGGKGSRAWEVWRRDGRSTASPNAGQSMAAMAGALGVTLEKRGHYRLGAGPPPDVAAIDRATRVFAAAAGVSLAAALLLLRAVR